MLFEGVRVAAPFFYGFEMQKKLWILVLFLLPLSAEAVDGPYEQQWLKLLHYQKKGVAYVSVVEKGDFFLTNDGKENPQAEYDAAIRAFSEKGNLKKCDFPARFMVLKKEGKVDGNLDDCEEYQQYLRDLQPKDVTMLFTDAYMNNPSSMFGHTLFRIDTKRKGTQLLAHGANFGADTGDENGPLYVLKGLWGGYFGTFGLKPYYDVINLYNNIENRDIWEYQLDFSDDELALFVAHMWEMKNAKIRYYFASKNCSYVLLLMLEAVKPELELSKDFRFYTVPLATLKSVNKVQNFIKSVSYRPSRQSKLKYRVKQMNKQQLRVFKDIIKKNEIDLTSLGDEEKADVLETAYQYVQYCYVEKDLELADYRKRSFKLLHKRSKIANQHQYFDELKNGKNPVLAHEDMQAGMMFGVRNGERFQSFSFKPVYNSLTEDSYGLLKGAEINMLSGEFRHYDNQKKYVLHNLDVLHVKSLSGQDIMFSPLSFEIDTGFKRLFDSKTEEDHTAAVVALSEGVSYALTENLFVYAMVEQSMAYGGGIRHQWLGGVAVKGGIYYNRDKWRLSAETKEMLATNYLGRGQMYRVEGAYGLTRNVMLYASGHYFNAKWHDDEEMMFGIKFSF